MLRFNSHLGFRGIYPKFWIYCNHKLNHFSTKKEKLSLYLIDFYFWNNMKETLLGWTSRIQKSTDGFIVVSRQIKQPMQIIVSFNYKCKNIFVKKNFVITWRFVPAKYLLFFSKNEFAIFQNILFSTLVFSTHHKSIQWFKYFSCCIFYCNSAEAAKYFCRFRKSVGWLINRELPKMQQITPTNSHNSFT